MNEIQKVAQIKKLSARRNNLLQKVCRLDNQINSLLQGIQTRKEVHKYDHPKPGSGPAKLCKVMSNRPKLKDEIAKQTGLTVGTVTLYLHQYACFKSAGRGKGYIYHKPKE